MTPLDPLENENTLSLEKALKRFDKLTEMELAEIARRMIEVQSNMRQKERREICRRLNLIETELAA